MNTTNCAHDLAMLYPAWEGAKVLQLLISHPNTDIYATTLELCLQSSLSLHEAQNTRYHLSPIKMTDEQTLKAVKQRLNKLIAIKAEQTSQPLDSPTSRPLDTPTSRLLDPSTSRLLDSEISALTQYIKETTLPTGTIKCFNDDDTKAFRRQASAIRRLLAQATKDGHHEAVAHINQQLKKGRIMRWEA